MQIRRSISKNAITDSGCVLTIGNFDGVHIGHQSIMAQLVAAGKRLGLPTAVMTFMPSPDDYFQGEKSAPRIATISSRYFVLKDLGIDYMFALPFNANLAATSAEDFIRKYLVQGLNAKYILVGDDFRFGKVRAGDFAYLEGLSGELGYEVERYDTVLQDDRRISSSRVRKNLADGDLMQVERLLGRKFSMVGRVTHGAKLGRQWGFPTLNIPIKHKLPCTGVFAVQVKGINNKTLPGVANLGSRPTVDGLKTLLEVHLFEFSGDIYGHRICVEFIEKIRDEKKFESFDDLKMQIGRDCESARQLFGLVESSQDNSNDNE